MHFFLFSQPEPKTLEAAYMGAAPLAATTYAHQALALLKMTCPGAVPALMGLSLMGHDVHPVMVRNDHAQITWLAENKITLNSYRHFDSRATGLIQQREAPAGEPVVHLYTPPLLPELLALSAGGDEGGVVRILLLASPGASVRGCAEANWGKRFDLILAGSASLVELAEAAGGERVVETAQIGGNPAMGAVIPAAVGLEVALRSALDARGAAALSQTSRRSLNARENEVETLRDCIALLQRGAVRDALWLLEILDQVHPGWDDLQTLRSLAGSALGYPDGDKR